jgi:hypothetical protein
MGLSGRLCHDRGGLSLFHLFKSTRIYSGRPYCGPASGGVPAEFEDIGDALRAQSMMSERNPVGFDVFDSTTGQCVMPFVGCQSNAE